jgi:hypothetical protein
MLLALPAAILANVVGSNLSIPEIVVILPWSDSTRARIAYQVQEATIPCWKGINDADGCRCAGAMLMEKLSF